MPKFYRRFTKCKEDFTRSKVQVSPLTVPEVEEVRRENRAKYAHISEDLLKLAREVPDPGTTLLAGFTAGEGGCKDEM